MFPILTAAEGFVLGVGANMFKIAGHVMCMVIWLIMQMILKDLTDLVKSFGTKAYLFYSYNFLDYIPFWIYNHSQKDNKKILNALAFRIFGGGEGN